MSRGLTIGLLKWGAILALALSAKSALASEFDGYSPVLVGVHDVRFAFHRPELAGFEIDRLADRLQSIEVRGWRVARHAWFGQTRIAHHGGVGFVIQNGNIVYQLNYRGVQVTKYF